MMIPRSQDEIDSRVLCGMAVIQFTCKLLGHERNAAD
jgi:hypothetical protein